MGRRKKITGSLWLFAGVIFALIMVLGVLFVTCTVGEEKNKDVGLPKVELLLNDTTLEEIYLSGRDEKYEGNEIFLKDGDNSVFLTGVQIKGRGNTSWDEPKKPFRIKFANRVDLLGLGFARKWVLLANNLDDTLMRNDIAFYVNRLLDGDYAMDGRFVVLYVDGKELGVYYLMKSISDNRGVVRLHDPMGVLVELDNLHGDGELVYETEGGNCLTLKNVASDDVATEALNEFGETFEEIEYYASIKDYENLKNVADLESFAEYFLITEFTNNPDGFSTSWWFYKDGAGDVIHVGPAWDFDFALGNTRWGDVVTSDFHDPAKPLTNREGAEDAKEQSVEVAKIIYHMLEIPEFRAMVEKIYRERLMGKSKEVVLRIKENTKLLREVAISDAEKWGKWDFDTEVERLIWWVEKRFRMMDEEYGGRTPIPVSEEEI